MVKMLGITMWFEQSLALHELQFQSHSQIMVGIFRIIIFIPLIKNCANLKKSACALHL